VSATYLVPRVVGRRWAGPIVARAIPWVVRAGWPLAPFIPRRDPSARTTLAAVLSGADTEALAAADEMTVVSAVLAFADRPVRELMTPRTAIVAVPEGTLAAEVAHVCAQAGYSRYPVYRGSLDEVIGVAHAFDLLTLQPEDPVPARPALTAPGTTRAADLMLEMQRGRGHLGVVLDEFGGTAGIVTMEDLLEEIFGDIRDEYDTEEFEERKLSNDEFIFSGRLELDYINRKYNLDLPENESETLSGYIINQHETIPHLKDRIILGDYEFEILNVSDTRIEEVRVKVLK